ncbi:E3 ubiquitin-protein ligase BRE1-like 1 [Camellia lanceoleosa]|uniref:E3 ubiquitin-protein ligase BRE1-like 1 n=1 Tax=Camellia lanceoleosa TaxID=1840588 RepID=A0ACC0G2Q7_9ERIC|nr:E3 ubiquitin-protein ligase BRE1-like 1 [Camellia lanceoleosa]
MIASPIPQSSPIFLSYSFETTLKDGTLLSRSWKKTVSQEAKVLGMSLKLGILNTRHGLTFKPSLDEQTLELQVKTSIGAKAISQQRLAAAEAKIADLRQKLEASKREKSRLSDILKSKHEENEAYISEIEVNEVGSVTKSIEAMKISKRVGSSIADFPTGLDMVVALLKMTIMTVLSD